MTTFAQDYFAGSQRPSPPHRTVNVTSETGRLQSVVIGYADNFDLSTAEIINETQKKYYFGPDRPQREILIHQLDRYARTLEANGVEVLRPTPLPNVPDQMMVRDIGVVIGDTFLLTRMAKESRRREVEGIQHILDQLPFSKKVVIPEDIVVEGGDIIVDKGHIFVGIGQRTTIEGAGFLAEQFPEYQVVPLFLNQIDDGVDVLHLDCTFVPIGLNHALIYPGGFRHIPEIIRRSYRWIEVNAEEQAYLATNVLSISPTQIISRASSKRINRKLSKIGFEVIPLPFSDPPKTGGSFRCCSLPLARG